MNEFEMLGRQSVELAKLNAEYDRLLRLLDQVCTGAMPASRVGIDLAARSWQILPPPPPPAAGVTLTPAVAGDEGPRNLAELEAHLRKNSSPASHSD